MAQIRQSARFEGRHGWDQTASRSPSFVMVPQNVQMDRMRETAPIQVNRPTFYLPPTLPNI